MNDVDFPVARVLEGIEAAAAAGLAPIKINMVVQARRQRSHDRRDGAPLQGHRPHRPVHRVHGRGRDQRLADGRRRPARPRSSTAISRELPLEPVDANYYGEVAERWRYTRRQRGNRRDLVGHAGVLPHLHARADLDRRDALHVPVRERRSRSAIAAARQRVRSRRARRRSRASGARAATATPSSAPPRRRRRGRSRCRTSADEDAPQARDHARLPPAHVRRRGAERARRGARHADRRRASADLVCRQARDRHADDARPGARGARHRVSPQPAARALDRGDRRGPGRLGDRLGRGHDAEGHQGPRRQDEEAHRHHRLRPGHGVRRPHGGDRFDQAARRRAA